MDGVDHISLLPKELLERILKFVRNKESLFTVSKFFYEFMCIASENKYHFSLHLSKINDHFESIVGSKRLIREFAVDELNLNALSKNELQKLLAIFEKCGNSVYHLRICCVAITEKDVCHMLHFFPNIESLSICRDYSNESSAPRVIFQQENKPLVLPSLKSISFNSKTLQFDKIFDNVQLTDKFKSLDVTIADPSICFHFLRKHSSIDDLSITSRHTTLSIPLNHLWLVNLSLHIPKSIQLMPLIEQQTNLENLDLVSDEGYSDEDDSDSFDENSDSSDEIRDLDLLTRAANMNNLTNLSVSIDGISKDDFIHFSKLSTLQQLSITSRKLVKIQSFSTIAFPSVTRLLLHFKGVRVLNSDFQRIATNFPNVNELHYDGGYFCDALLCLAGNLKSLKKLSIMQSDDRAQEALKHFIPSGGIETNIVCSSLTSVTLYLSSPKEQHVHAIVVRLALMAPNVESLWIETDSMKIIHNHFVYILRNFKNLKNLKLDYNLDPADELVAQHRMSMARVEEYARVSEQKIINILREHGANLDFVEITLISPNDLLEEWKQTFQHQFASIEIDETSVTMKKDSVAEEHKLFV